MIHGMLNPFAVIVAKTSFSKVEFILLGVNAYDVVEEMQKINATKEIL
jgi:hypothetical protein